jgi:hypothetical protein
MELVCPFQLLLDGAVSSVVSIVQTVRGLLGRYIKISHGLECICCYRRGHPIFSIFQAIYAVNFVEIIGYLEVIIMHIPGLIH